MTLIEVIDQSRALLNEPLAAARTFPDDSSSFWTDTVLTGYCNLIQQEVANEIIQVFEDYFVTQTSVNVINNQAEYTLPSDYVKIRLIEDNRIPSHPIEITPIHMSEKQNQSGLVIGSATFEQNGYYFRGDRFILDATPTFSLASGILVTYVKRIPDITAASSVSELPIEHHRVLVWGIVKLALFQQQSDPTVAVQEFEKHMVMIKKQCESRQIQRPRKVGKVKTNWS